jgi:hypothetical protein
LKFDEIYVENVGQHRAVGDKMEKKGKFFSGRVKTTDQNKFQVKNLNFQKISASHIPRNLAAISVTACDKAP